MTESAEKNFPAYSHLPYDWTPETRYGSMKSVSLQRIQPLTEQLNLGLTAGKVWYDTPTDDFNGLQLAARLTWKF